MPETQTGEFARRSVLKAGGSGAAALAVGAIGSAGPFTASAVAATPRSSDPLDIWFGFNSFGLNADGKAPLEVVVGNSGPGDAVNDVLVYVITPFYANFDASSFPAEFTEYVVNNPAPNIPEMIKCTVPAASLPAGAHVTFTVNLELVPNGPRLLDFVSGFADPNGNTETTLLNNEAVGTVSVPILPKRTVPSGANVVNLYFTYTVPVLKSEATKNLKVYVGNRGPGTPTSNAVFTFVSPVNAKIDRSNLAFSLLNPTYYHDIADPQVPDIVSFPVSRLLLPPDPNLIKDLLNLGTFSIPLIAHDGSFSNRGGKGMLAVGGSVDFDPDPAIAINRIGTIQPT